MDLINEIRSDIAIAFLIDKAHTEKLDSLGAKQLIDRLENALAHVARRESTDSKAFTASTGNPDPSH